MKIHSLPALAFLLASLFSIAGAAESAPTPIARSGPAVPAAAIPDGGGGMIVVSYFKRPGGYFADLYVQKVNAAGVPQWTTLGAALCTTADASTSPALTSDGSGGVILAWLDFRGPSAVYVQRVGSSGTALWAAGGVQLCTTAHSVAAPDIVGDGGGGAIVAWRDNRTDDGDIYAQRVNSNGTPQWSAGGVAICTATAAQTYPRLVTDGSSGAIVHWQDARNGNTDIYGQRINGVGVPQWIANGAVVCTAVGNQHYRDAIADGVGGMFIAWSDLRTGTADIYAQRLSSGGASYWTPDGAPVCTAANTQIWPVLTTDGAGGVIVSWQDKRGGVDYDTYAQRLSGSGVAQWTPDGVALCTSAGDQTGQVIASDGSGGAVVTWVNGGGMRRVYAQRVNASGVPQWTANGVAVCPDRIFEQYDPVIAADPAGGAFVGWTDYGLGEPEIYGQRMTNAGTQAWGSGGVGLILDPGIQRLPVSIPDGSGGIILAWMERQPGKTYDIFARRISSTGTIAWPRVPICTAAESQFWPVIISDGAGGAIIAWADLRAGLNMGIYAQRVNASGAVQWTTDGVALATGAGVRMGVGIATDGAGGSIACWQDSRSGAGYDILAQRVDATGAPLWAPNGVPVCTAIGNQTLMGDPGTVPVVSDGAGGAYVAWMDTRNPTTDIYAQRINASGSPMWTANGEVVCAAAGQQQSQTVAFDAYVPGLFVVWEDYRSGTNYDVYAQRMTPTGSASWSTGGVAVESGTTNGYNPRIVADGLGGAIVAWHDYRTSDGNIYAQRLSSVGSPLWTSNGVTVCGAGGDQWKPEIVEDANNGAIVTWEDKRSGNGNEAGDLYAQRLNSQGIPLWTSDGVVVCNASDLQTYPAIVRDGAGGAAISWQDRRDGKSDYVYSQRLNSAGLPLWTSNGVTTSVPLPSTSAARLSLQAVRPNPSRGPLTLTFTLPQNDAASVELLDVAGRRIASKSLDGLGPGSHVITWDHRVPLSPGIYLAVLRQCGESQARKVCVLK